MLNATAGIGAGANTLRLPNLTSRFQSTFGFGNVTNTANKSVVLGEGMGDIKSVAKQLQSQGVNAKWYQAWSKNFPKGRPMTPDEMAAALKRNQRWIKIKIKEGYDFYDIGIDPTRSARSRFYKLEQQTIEEMGANTMKLNRP